MIKFILYNFIGCFCLSMNLSAQSLSPFVISSTGGSSSGSELSWTIGETFTETFIGRNNILTQGFQQPELQVNMGNIPSSLCASAQISVAYSASGIISNTNYFIAEISDKYGSFSNAVIIGSVFSNSSGIINAFVPNTISIGTQYKIRVRSTSPSFISDDNGIGIYINPKPCYIHLSNTKTVVDSVPVNNPTLKSSKSISIASNLNVTVMPNPTTSNFKIIVQSSSAEPINIKISDVTGRIMEVISKQVFKITNVTATFGQTYRGGTYFAEVIQGNNHKTITLIKLN